MYFFVANYVLEQKSVKNTDPPLDIQRKLNDSNNGCTSMILDNKTLKNLDVIPNQERDDQAATLFRCDYFSLGFFANLESTLFSKIVSYFCGSLQNLSDRYQKSKDVGLIIDQSWSFTWMRYHEFQFWKDSTT